MNKHEFEVIGSGCKKCKELFELTKTVVGEIDIEGSVSYSTDISKIINLGLVSSPVLTVDGKPILVGILPDKKKLAELIQKELSAKVASAPLIDEASCSGCSRGSN